METSSKGDMMKYFSLKEPRDAVWIYAHCPDINHFGLAQSPEVVAGKVYEGEENHFDGAGNQLKSYGVGLFLWSVVCSGG